jgi:hypothetical protein
MMELKRTATLAGMVLFPLALAACESITGSSASNLVIRTEQPAFAHSDTGSVLVSFTVTNSGSETAYLSRCGDNIRVGAERRQGGAWESYMSGICLGIFDMSPMPIEPGETREGGIRIPGPGVFRLRLGSYDDPAGPTDWTITSNRFWIVD